MWENVSSWEILKGLKQFLQNKHIFFMGICKKKHNLSYNRMLSTMKKLRNIY